jgi:hypothetical protein
MVSNEICNVYNIKLHYIKYFTFHCNIAHELKDTGIKTKRILYDQVFVTYISHIFNEDTVNGRADIISVFNFSPRVDKQVSRGFLLYKCSQSDQAIYTTCKSTFLLPVPFQTPLRNLLCNATADLHS